MTCSKCGAENSGDALFCEQCGAKLERSCPSCGAAVSPDARFCKRCGQELGSQPPVAAVPKATTRTGVRVAPDQPASDVIDGERKTVTALFADIKGSMELMADLDPEEARAIIDPALKLMIDAAHRYDGYIVQSTGDGIFALFGAPVAHEDHPQRALYAALRMQEELRRYSARLREAGNLPVEARVGVNTGEVVVRSITTGENRTEYTPIGHTTNLAARIQALAPTGSIAATEPTRKLCEGYFTFNRLGPTRVKGVAEPVEVHEATGLGPLRTRLQRAEGRGLTKFVGRQPEMDAMRRAADLAKAGHGQLVAAMAEPGVGKSRLLYEFKATAQSAWTVLETFSVSHGKASAYLPVIDLLRNYFDISAEDDERKRREKVIGKVLGLDRTLEDTLPYLFVLLGIVEGADPLAQMDWQIKKRRTLEALKRILLRDSLKQPLMVIFEDLHWMDAESQALVNLLADSIGTANVLLLVNYRPEYRHEWGNKTYYTQLRLDPLGKESAEEMLDTLLGSGPPLPGQGEGRGVGIEALKHLIIDKTEGNPFFMEEMVQTLFEQGALVRNGAIKLTRPLAELKIPPTVQAILASRIDRLPPAEKDLLQTLAVLGKEFPLSMVREATARPRHELERMLHNLQLGEFIYGQSAFPDPEYSFKHALTQEVAYNAILIERRKLLHQRIGTALESLYITSLDDHLAELAHHYGRSANLDKAVDYVGRAAQQAVSRSAFNEALSLGRAGVAMISALPPTAERRKRNFDLHHALVRAATVIEGLGSPQTESGYRRMFELARESGDDPALSAALGGMWRYHDVTARYQEAAGLARQMLEVAERRKTQAALADAHQAHGATLMIWTGRVAETLKELNQAIALCPDGVGRISNDGVDPLASSLSFAALGTSRAGYPDRAVNLIQSAVKRSRDLNQPYSLGCVLYFETGIRYWRGEWLETQHLCGRVEALAEEGGFPSLLVLNRIPQGWVACMQGEDGRGIGMIRSGIANWAPFAFTHHSSILAEACLRAGRYQEVMDAVAAAREHAARTGEHFARSEIERVAGEALMLMGAANASAAEQCMRRAVAIAAQQGAKSWELRATTSLARLLRDTGRRDEARVMLAEIYGWFTEGFDTADLKGAKALLDELEGSAPL